MKSTIWLIGMIAVIAAGVAIFVWSGTYDVAADEPHWAATSKLLETVRHRSIAVRAADIAVPKLDDDELIRHGAGNYDAMCAGCHLRPGLERSELSVGLYPPPPNLAQRHDAEPARDFLTIKHGIKMTGMPAWGTSMGDDYIWGMVALLQTLPDLPEAEYRALVDASGGHAHGGGETDMQEHGETEMQDHHDEAPHEHAGAPPAKPAPHGHEDATPHEH